MADFVLFDWFFANQPKNNCESLIFSERLKVYKVGAVITFKQMNDIFAIFIDMNFKIDIILRKWYNYINQNMGLKQSKARGLSRKEK